MLTIHIYNTYSYFQNSLEEIPQNVIDACDLSFSYWITKKQGGKTFPEQQTQTYHYFHKKYKSFPTGWLYSHIVSALKESEQEYKLIDKRHKAKAVFDHVDPPSYFETRDYMERALDKSLRHKRGVIRIGTGGGKTELAAYIINTIRVPTLFSVPNIDLLYQANKVMSTWFGEDRVGVIGDSEWNPQLITISTIQTLWSRYKEEYCQDFLKSRNMLILDECHGVNVGSYQATNTWYKVAMRTKNAFYRFGLSATPGEEGEKQFELLRATTGGIVVDVPSKYLIEQGYLSEVEVQIYEIPNVRRKGHWMFKYRIGIVENEKRNSFIASLANTYAEQGKKVIISTERKNNHIERITDYLTEEYQVMTGDVKGQEREENFDEFENENLNILIGTVMKVGVNLPNAEVLINAGAMKSDRMTIQKAGRVLRTADKKEKAIIVDFYDKDNNLLEKWSNQRIDTYEKVNYPVRVMKYEEI